MVLALKNIPSSGRDGIYINCYLLNRIESLISKHYIMDTSILVSIKLNDNLCFMLSLILQKCTLCKGRDCFSFYPIFLYITVSSAHVYERDIWKHIEEVQEEGQFFPTGRITKVFKNLGRRNRGRTIACKRNCPHRSMGWW